MDIVFYKSKTFWTQILGSLVVIVTAIVPMDYKPVVMAAQVLVMAILTVVFRWTPTITQGGLTLK